MEEEEEYKEEKNIFLNKGRNFIGVKDVWVYIKRIFWEEIKFNFKFYIYIY